MKEKLYRVCTGTFTIGSVDREDLSDGFKLNTWYYNLIGDGHHAYFASEDEAKHAFKEVLKRQVHWLREKIDSLDTEGD